MGLESKNQNKPEESKESLGFKRPKLPNLPFAHLGSTLTSARTKRKQKLKRLNILVVGGSKVGKSSLVEHLLLTLNREEARDIFAAQNQSVLPFGNLVYPTTKIVEYPISTDTLRVKLIDTPGISEADGTKLVQSLRSLINSRLIKF